MNACTMLPAGCCSCCEDAARVGDLCRLQQAHRMGCLWNDTAWAAAKGQHWEVLLWALQHGCPWTMTTFQRVVRDGCLPIAQWMYEHWFQASCGSPQLRFEDILLFNAAGNGHLHLLQWAYDIGLQGHWLACWEAARGGHLQALQSLRNQGCPWNKSVAECASTYEVLAWAVANKSSYRARTLQESCHLGSV